MAKTCPGSGGLFWPSPSDCTNHQKLQDATRFELLRAIFDAQALRCYPPSAHNTLRRLIAMTLFLNRTPSTNKYNQTCSQKTDLLLVNLGFFRCHMCWARTKQFSALYIETDAPRLPQIIGRKLTRLLIDNVLSRAKKPENVRRLRLKYMKVS